MCLRQGADPGFDQGNRFPLKSNIYSFDQNLVFIITLSYNQSLLSYFFCTSFFNRYLKMVILIVYLILKAFVLLFAFIHLCQYFVISLGVFHVFP